MRICYIYREKERGAHSIELVFDTISTAVEGAGISIERWYKPVSNLRAIIQLLKLKADIYHITGDCYYLSLFLPWKKTIMTIHDIGMYKNHPKTLRTRLFAFLSFILPLKLIRISTTISKLTKDDLVRLLHISPNKIVVIPNPLVLPLVPIAKTFDSDCPVILQIGSGHHKNLIGLIESVRYKRCKLEIVGRPTEQHVNLMKSYGIQYNISKNLSNSEIQAKYYSSDIVYFASVSEGFGLPILEAQAAGRVVVTSNMEPMSSVGADGCVKVDPYNYEEIRSALDTITSNQEFRNNVIKNGFENVKRYSLDNILKQYLDLYNQF